jgi:hypothetical protein
MTTADAISRAKTERVPTREEIPVDAPIQFNVNEERWGSIPYSRMTTAVAFSRAKIELAPTEGYRAMNLIRI